MIQLNYLAFAIPAFFLFLYLEYRLAIYLKKPEIFKYESSIANISIGVAERLLNLFISASFYSLFYWIYKNYALVNIPNAWWVWELHLDDKLFTASAILITLINCGALLEQRKWIYYLECFRLILLLAYTFWKCAQMGWLNDPALKLTNKLIIPSYKRTCVSSII